jgi:acetolactate synthase-1/2/3 large subunit
LGVGILESVPNYVNFPTDDPLYQGHQWNEPRQNRVLAEADVILALDSDVPWIPLVNRPSKDARIFQIDVDPLKEQMPLWQIPAKRVFRADAATVLRQINELLDREVIEERAVHQRQAHYEALHLDRCQELLRREQPDSDFITPEYLTSRIRHFIDHETIVLNEGISNYQTIIDHLMMTKPGSMFTSGGGSLGWHGGAAIGAKLANPEKTVVCLTGDGSYLFSVPASVHWIARRYRTPFLQIIYNNRGWKSPKLSTLAVHPSGYASRTEDLGVSFDPPPDYAGIAAAAGGAFAQTIKKTEELDGALKAALDVVKREGRCAVIDVWLPSL